jgi:heptaprenyl diphosphate synthase
VSIYHNAGGGVMKTMDEKSKSAANEGVFNISSERKKGLKPNLKRINTKKLAELSVFTSVAMILSYVEALIPSVGIPGAKLGLANIAVIFILYRFGWREAAAVSLVRVLLVSLLFGSIPAMIYSIAGATLSLIVMVLLKRTDTFSSVGVSVAGGVSHNAGQIAVAAFMLGTKEIAYYMPVLIISGIIAGIIVGLCGAVLVKYVKY